MSKTNNAIAWVAVCVLLLAGLIEQGQGGGGISGSGSVRGSLQRFASVVANDAELDSSQSVVTVNGRTSTLSALRVGQQVDIAAAAMESGQADSITYFSSVWGPIESVDVATGTLRVLGQDITTSAVTNFEHADLATLAQGSWVEVSGLRTGPSALLATYVRGAKAGAAVRLTGVLYRITSTGNLRVAGMTIQTTELQRTGLAIGQTLSIKGALNEAGTAIRASRIDAVDELSAAATNLSVEGIPSTVTTGKVVMGGQAFKLTSATAFINGTQSRLAPGARIGIDATRTDSGVFASAVVFRPTRDVLAEGVLDDIQPLTADSARITVSGLTLLITQGTDYGRSANPAYNIASLQDLVVGDYLKVRGYVDGREGAANRIDRTPYQTGARLTALVSARTSAGFDLLGNPVVLGPATTFKVASIEVTLEQFLAALEIGDFVEVRYQGDWSPGMAADRVTIVDAN